MNLKDKKILITGGSSGIGKETAIMCIEKGAKVVITGLDRDKLNKCAKEIGAIPLDFDICKYENIKYNTNRAVELMQGLDVLVNNAGIGKKASLEELSIELFEQTYATNVFGLAMLTQAVANYFKKNNAMGTIINIGSTASSKGYANGTVYASSKFALKGMTQCWQAELRKHNIRVMLICPSEVTTAFAQPDRKQRDEIYNKLHGRDVAHAIVSAIELRDKGFITELTIWATNPF